MARILAYIAGVATGILLAVIVQCCVIAAKRVEKSEDYVSKREKAESIYGWFKDNKNPRYTDYKNDVQGSDIVEYNSAKNMHRAGKLSVGGIEEHIL